MKKATLVILASIMGVKLSAFADVDKARKLTPLQKIQIAWALKILGETDTVTVNQNQCIQFDQDILSVLESEGHIQNGDAQPNTVCFGGGPSAAK